MKLATGSSSAVVPALQGLQATPAERCAELKEALIRVTPVFFELVSPPLASTSHPSPLTSNRHLPLASHVSFCPPPCRGRPFLLTSLPPCLLASSPPWLLASFCTPAYLLTSRQVAEAARSDESSAPRLYRRVATALSLLGAWRSAVFLKLPPRRRYALMNSFLRQMIVTISDCQAVLERRRDLLLRCDPEECVAERPYG